MLMHKKTKYNNHLKPKRNTRIGIIDKRRFTIFISIILSLIIFLTIIIIQTAVHGDTESKYTEIHIYNGDNLWKIAKEYNKKYKDIRDFIDVIMLENNMESAMIYSGNKLKIPIE